MKIYYKKIRFFIFIILLCFMNVTVSFAENRPQFLAHYMPWYQTPEVSGYWGYHWTMNHFNPENMDSSGFRSIASIYYPLTGPYDSKDPLILEYQTLLMKLSGIDGVLVDWYGIEDFWDYGVLNEATHALFAAISKARLSFAIVYEDQTLTHMINNGHIEQNSALAHGQRVMNYLQENWFATDAYMKINGFPLLLTFGPQYFKNSSDWQTIFSNLTPQPLFFTLDNRLATVAAGAYPWPPMWKSINSGILTRQALNEYLQQFYQKASQWDYLVTSAFPGFEDIYKRAGVGEGYGILDRQNGQTFKNTLQQAVETNPDVIQIVTWNDYGEGTIVEPTDEFEYQYLEIIRQTRGNMDSDFLVQSEDLTLPFSIYKLRKEYRNDSRINASLDQIYHFIISNDIDSARILLDSLITAIENPVKNPGCFGLRNYPNPFNERTIFDFSLPTDQQIDLSIFDICGKKVKTLLSNKLPAGPHQITWDGSSDIGVKTATGVYLYKFYTKSCIKKGRMLLLR